MRTTEKLQKFKVWAEETLCRGRRLKAPASDRDVTKIVYREPSVFLAWSPMRLNKAGTLELDTSNTTPSITIMPSMSYAKMIEEKRFDRYQGVHRPVNLGNQLSVTMLFSVFEPGTRLPGFTESGDENGKGLDLSLFQDGTEQGLMTLLDWIDDAKKALLQEMCIPGTDMALNEQSLVWSLYTDQQYVTDRRPIYYGFINCTFGGYVDEGNKRTNKYLL